MLRHLSAILICSLLAAFSLQARGVNLKKDYKAKADGSVKVTSKLQKAIDDVSASGGGKVVLSGGVFLSGPIELKTGVELFIDAGSTLLASPDLKDYPDRENPRHVDTEALPRWRNIAFIYADEAENIAISGRGTIDGNGTFHIKEKVGENGNGWPFERIAPARESLPRMVFFAGCKDVKVVDVSLVNLPAGWGYWIHDCDRVQFDRCKILSDVRYPNNDGIHINCSRDVTVSNCFIETGDDSIIIRANSRSLKENKACERVVVTNCILRSWSSAVRIGWVNDGVIRDCSFSNLVIRDSSNGIGCYIPRMKYVTASNDYGREATLLENLAFSNIVMDEIYGNPIYVKVADEPGIRFAGVRNLRFCNVSSRALEDPYFGGRPEVDASQVFMENCNFEKCSPKDFPGDRKRHGYVLTAR